MRRKLANHRQKREQGYVLLALLLVLALVAVAATVAAPGIVFQMKRDREEELVHRGIQYRRALRLYSARTGGFPNTLEQLLGSADRRYIRKLYKDPITGGDFRLLHMADVQPGVGVASPNQPNQNGPGNAPFGNAGVGNSGFGNNSFGNNNFGNPGYGINGSGSGNGVQPNASSEGSSGTIGSESSNTTGQSNPQPGTSTATTGALAGTSTNTSPEGSQPGLLIFGVASKSKDRTIREFYNKNHYNDWWFFYDPRANGYEFKGPTPPPGTPVQNNGVAPQSNPTGSQTGFAPPNPQSGPQPQTPQ
jgi:type II secretory pathway pseudopilin PulG